MLWGCLVLTREVQTSISTTTTAIEACRQAVTDHRSAGGITAEIHPVDWTAVWWRKPPA
jgi:hypothetical protein